jgi:AcrR family transcriptional regulator
MLMTSETATVFEVSDYICVPNFVFVQEKILQVAYKSFKSIGIKAVTMDSICTELSISKKTFYQFYENKDALVDTMICSEMQRSSRECIQAFEQSENAIDEIFLSMSYANKDINDLNPILIHDLKKYYPEAYNKFMGHFHILYKDVIRNNIQRGVKEGLYREGLNIEILTSFRLQSMFVAFDQQIFPKEEFSLLEVTHTILENFLFGIVTQQGLQKIQEYKQKYKNIL